MPHFSSFLATATSSLLHGYLSVIGKTIKTGCLIGEEVSWEEEATYFLQQFFCVHNYAGPALYLLWIADHLNLVSLGYVSPSFRQMARQFKFFADDSFGGLVMRRTIRSLGAESLPISQADPVKRLQLLRSVMLNRPSVFLAVDGRGPYFKIGTGIVNLAIAIRGTVIPCSILARPALNLTNLAVSVTLPLPRSRLLIAVGKPISHNELKASGPPAAVALRLEQDLLGVRGNANRLLAQA